jgi:hypothetical protein
MKEAGKNYLLRNLFFISMLPAGIISCRKYDLNEDVVDDSQLLEKLYLNAKDSIEIDNQNLVLKTELYRDFFPVFQVEIKDYLRYYSKLKLIVHSSRKSLT